MLFMCKDTCRFLKAHYTHQSRSFGMNLRKLKTTKHMPNNCYYYYYCYFNDHYFLSCP